MARTWYAVMNEIDTDAVDTVGKIISLPATWDAHKGVAVVNTPYYKGVTSSVPCVDVHTVYYNPI